MSSTADKSKGNMTAFPRKLQEAQGSSVVSRFRCTSLSWLSLEDSAGRDFLLQNFPGQDRLNSRKSRTDKKGLVKALDSTRALDYLQAGY